MVEKIKSLYQKHPQWPKVKRICKVLNQKGHQAWLAGGCVRDGLLGIVPKDFDIATDARPEQVESFFPKTVNVGKAFGVIRVVEGKYSIEVASFRVDGPYLDGRHPESIEYSSPSEDARRRDFTVNALFLDPKTFEVHDFVDGVRDLKQKVISAVGDPRKRFQEDKLRALRALRFVAQLGFHLDQKTFDAIKEFSPVMNQVSWERITEELGKLLSSAHSHRGLDLMIQTEIYGHLFPELTPQKKTGEILKRLSKTDHFSLFWVAFFWKQDLGPLSRLKMSNGLREQIEGTLKILPKVSNFFKLSKVDQRLTSASPYFGLAIEFEKATGKNIRKVSSFHRKNSKLPEPYLKPQDLLKIGIPQGPKIGETLRAAFFLQLDGKFKTRKQALGWLKTRYFILPE